MYDYIITYNLYGRVFQRIVGLQRSVEDGGQRIITRPTRMCSNNNNDMITCILDYYYNL